MLIKPINTIRFYYVNDFRFSYYVNYYKCVKYRQKYKRGIIICTYRASPETLGQNGAAGKYGLKNDVLECQKGRGGEDLHGKDNCRRGLT